MQPGTPLSRHTREIARTFLALFVFGACHCAHGQTEQFGVRAIPPSVPPTSESPIDSGQVNDAINQLIQRKFVRQDQITVSKYYPVLGASIAARRITFQPESQMILGVGSLSGNSVTPSNTPILIWADEIEIQGRAVITWAGDLPANEPPPRAKAPDGLTGAVFGASGSPGTDGDPGNAGFAGRNAPSILIVANRVIGGPLLIDLRGGDGGPGGRGQDGGNGGSGARGSPAVSSIFDCRSGPGRGGDAGKGGDAGPGGPGGQAGSGGDIVLITLDPAASTAIKAYLDAGERGKGGDPGQPGRAGQPGDEGFPAPPLCSPANPRRIGNTAGSGKELKDKGKPGLPGTSGRLLKVGISQETFNELITKLGQ